MIPKVGQVYYDENDKTFNRVVWLGYDNVEVYFGTSLDKLERGWIKYLYFDRMKLIEIEEPLKFSY